MKIWFTFFALFLFSARLFSQENKDYLGVTEITFNETKHVLTEANQKSKILFVQDYINEEERLEDASHIITLYFFNKEIDAKTAAEQKIAELENRTKTDKYCTYNLTESPDGKEFVIDFFTSNVNKEKGKDKDKKDGQDIKENSENKGEMSDYNIYRLKNIKIGENTAFLIIAYKEIEKIGDTKYFQKKISKVRNSLIEGIILMKVPDITLNH